MGYYVNPKDGLTKEEWLARNGRPMDSWTVAGLYDSQGKPNGEVAVCVVDNGYMTAAGIAYDASEMEAFMHPDGRPKKWYAVSRDLLRQFVPEGLI